jgi:chromosome segregation ATPase
MPQDDQLLTTLGQVSDIAQMLGRIEAIERQLTTEIGEVETKLTAVQMNLDKYGKQIERLESDVEAVKRFADSEGKVEEAAKTLTEELSKTNAKTLQAELEAVATALSNMNSGLGDLQQKANKAKSKLKKN